MFGFKKGLDVITLFHNPNVTASTKVLSLLKRANEVAGARSSGLSSGENGNLTNSTLKTEFELQVEEQQPTHDQMRSILDYVGATGAGEIVKGAKDDKDALKQWKSNPANFQRPVTVDWNNGKVVAGANESAILKMLESLPQ